MYKEYKEDKQLVKKILYKKSTGVLLKSTLGNIKKEKLKVKKSDKGNK